MLDSEVSLIMACTVGRTQSSKKVWSEEEEEELRRLYEEFTNKAQMEGGNREGGDYTHTHTQNESQVAVQLCRKSAALCCKWESPMRKTL